MKNVLIINGHPDSQSYCKALASEYYNSVLASGNNAKIINLIDLKFNPNLMFGYRSRTELEPDLLSAIEEIKAADHLVFVFPIWWSNLPAILKAFIDRTFLPSITFEYISNSIMHKKLLTNKTARLIITMDAPKWYYKYYVKQPAVNALKKGTLQFCGINPVKVTYFSPLKRSSLAQRTNWLNSIKSIAAKDIK